MYTPFIVLALTLGGLVKGWPGMAKTLQDIQSRADTWNRSTVLLGDLRNTKREALTPTGVQIRSILEGIASAQADGMTSVVAERDSEECRLDTCCIWRYIADDMVESFYEGDECSKFARGAIRLGFHDAAAWDTSSTFGGADGSILLSNELLRSENAGLEVIASETLKWWDKYRQYNVSMADLIQFGAIVATTSCPGGPQIRFYAGRKDNRNPAPTGLLPSPFQQADNMISLFQAKTFSAADLVALVGAHSVSRQFFVDTRKAGFSQDSTAGIMDTNFYGETLRSLPADGVQGITPDGVFFFKSDQLLSESSVTVDTWSSFSGAHNQEVWASAYASAYFRMSLLGVNNLNDLTECTHVVPPRRPIPGGF